MTEKQGSPSFASVISILPMVLYYAGFLRLELELNEHKERLNALENAVAENKPPTSEPKHAKTTRNIPGKFVSVLRIAVKEIASSFSAFGFNPQIQT